MFDYDEHRRRMIDEMSAFITWGLANPNKVRWIPRHRVGSGSFSEAMQRAFWGGVFGAARAVPTDVLRRFLRWLRTS
jgi:hypothetical protein